MALGASSPRERYVNPAVIAIGALAGISYAWGAAHGSLELYYEAAVRSMGSSWHDFFFGAFDPAGTISLDKLPGAFWVQALSVRVFGFHTWAIVLPQVIEGVLTVFILFRAVSRLAGDMAGVVAAGVVALTPASVALNRGNISDSLLILLLVLAANSTVTALVEENAWWLVLAGVWVGLAFQAKMLEAWLVLPALGLAWVVAGPGGAGPGGAGRRIAQFGGAVSVAAVVSLSWMTAVSLVPGGDRPYVDGSTHDSVFQQVFVYNGFGKVSTGSSLPGLKSAAFSDLVDFRLPGASGPIRLLDGAGGRDIGWLMVIALVSAVVVLGRRQLPREDPLRSAALLWGSWLLIDVVAFSALSGLNAYYLAALAPAVGALCGIGLELLRRSKDTGGRLTYAVLGLVLVDVVYGLWLMDQAPGTLRVFLVLAEVVLLGGAVWLMLGGRVLGPMLLGRHAEQPEVPSPTPGLFDTTRSTAGVFLALGAMALLPLSGSLDIVAAGLGPFDTPFESTSVSQVTQVEPKETLQSVRSGLALLLDVNKDDRYVAATFTSIIAAPLIIDTGREFEPIGGFTGTIPVPSVKTLREQVDLGRLQTIITPDVADPRVDWTRAHCGVVPTSSKGVLGGGPIAGINVYLCRARR